MSRGLRALLGFALVAAAASRVPAEEDVSALDLFLASSRDDAAPVLGMGQYVDSMADAGLLGQASGGDDDEESRASDPEFLREWLRGNGATGVLPAGTLRRAHVEVEITTEDGATARAEIDAPLGRRRAWSRVREHSVLAGYGVEIACDNSGGGRPCALGDPQVETVRDGFAVDLRAFSAGSDGRIAVEALVQWGTIEEPVETVSTGARFLGEVDLPRYRGGVVLLSGSVPEGQALTAHVQRESRTALVRIVPRIEEITTRRGSRPAVRIDTALATLGPWDVASGSAPFYGLVRGSPALPLDELAARIATDGRDVRADGVTGLWIGGEGTEVDAAVRSVDDVVARSARTVLVEVKALADGVVVGRFRVPALTGRTALLRVGEDRAFLADPDTEVG